MMSFKIILVMLLTLLSVAFLTLFERKLLSVVGSRQGPDKVGVFGVFQPILDAGKLLNKQENILNNFSFLYYYVGTFFLLFFSFFMWFFLYSEPTPIMIKFSYLFFFCFISANTMLFIFSAWSTFCKYSLIGSIRMVSQMISYEGVIFICSFMLFFIFFNYSFYMYNFLSFSFLCFSFPIFFLAWMFSALAELNRTPYDFSEGESELVSGFNVEFGSKAFTFVFLAEYSNIIFFMLITHFFFFYEFFIFFYFLLFLVVWVRSVLPRYRFDSLMMLAWKHLLPFLSIYFVFIYFLNS